MKTLSHRNRLLLKQVTGRLIEELEKRTTDGNPWGLVSMMVETDNTVYSDNDQLITSKLILHVMLTSDREDRLSVDDVTSSFEIYDNDSGVIHRKVSSHLLDLNIDGEFGFVERKS